MLTRDSDMYLRIVLLKYLTNKETLFTEPDFTTLTQTYLTKLCYAQVYNLHVFARGGDIGTENWDMRRFSLLLSSASTSITT